MALLKEGDLSTRMAPDENDYQMEDGLHRMREEDGLANINKRLPRKKPRAT